MYHLKTQKSRRYGFVTFSNKEAAKAATEAESHIVNYMCLDVKSAFTRFEKQPEANRPAQVHRSQSASKGVRRRFLNKVFIGGIKRGTLNKDIEAHFSTYGTLTRIHFNEDGLDEKWRGYCFITFKEESSASSACKQRFHLLNGKKVEVKIAVPKMEPIELSGTGNGTSTPIPTPIEPIYSVPHYAYYPEMYPYMIQGVPMQIYDFNCYMYYQNM